MEFAGIDEIYLSQKKIDKFKKLKGEINPSVIKEDDEDLKESGCFKAEEKKEEQDSKENNCKAEDKKEDQEKVNFLFQNLSQNPPPFNPPVLSEPPPAVATNKKYDVDECFSVDSNSCCSIEDKELEVGFDEEGNNMNFNNFQNMNVAPVANENYRNEMDLNILSLRFSELGQQIQPKIEKYQICPKCKGYLNKNCAITENNQKFLWKCSFCSNMNELQINQEDIPNNDTFEYYIEKVKVNDPKNSISSNSSLIFCFDTSGSMSQSYEIDQQMAKKLKAFRGYNNDQLRNIFSDNDFMFGNRGPSYITRLECVKIAIENNLKKILKEAPETKVGFVLFGTNIEVKGDCLSNRLLIPSQKLGDEQKIREMGIDNSSLLSHNIKESFQSLIKQLCSCEEGGQTALGPAALFSLSMLKGSGNKIFLCTDGCSNLGVGDISTNEDTARDFYKRLGEEAKRNGTIFNLITFDDQESEIDVLKDLVEISGGEIIRVNPKEIVEDFDYLLDNKFLATNVKVQVNLNQILSFRNEEVNALSLNKTIFYKEIGNISSDLELYFEFKFKKAKELVLFDGLNLENLKNLVFQSIITYTDLDHNKIVRVITKNMKVTTDKKNIEKKANYDIVSINATRKTANLASQGDYRMAMANNLAWKNYLGNQASKSQSANVNSLNYNQQMSMFHNELHTQSIGLNNRMLDNLSSQITSNQHQSRKAYATKSKRLSKK